MTPPQAGKPRQSALIEMISLSKRIETVATYAWSQKGNYAKISSILFLNEPLHPLHRSTTANQEPGIRSTVSACRLPVECFFPGRILHFAWISSVTFVTRNNTQGAVRSRSSCSECESDRRGIRDDRVDLEVQV